jgi:NADH-quinone oxidoreductase subunit K
MIGLTHFLVIGALLFALGMYTVLSRRNAIAILMGVELILNAGALNFAAFARFVEGGVEGYVFSVFVIVLAAAEAAVAMAIVLAIYQNLQNIRVDKLDSLQG